MKKHILPFVLLCLPLFSCGQEGPSSTDSSSFSSSSSVPSSSEARNYTIKQSDNGLTLSQTEFVFAQPKEGDAYYPGASIRMLADNTWRYCTALNERETKFFVQDESVIKEEELSLVTITKSMFGGTSNEIAALDIRFDRAKANVGTTMIEVELMPDSGISSMNVLTSLCFSLDIKPYGGIEVETYNVTLSADTAGLKKIVEKESENVTEVTLNITDTADRDDVYGMSADYHKETVIPLDNLDGGASIADIAFAKNHSYSVFIFVEGEKASDRIWLQLVPKGTPSGYSFSEDESGNSVLKVSQNNVEVSTKIGSYSAL